MSRKRPDIKIEVDATAQPRGENETSANFCFRLTTQRFCSTSIPPRGKNETDLDFINRVLLSKDAD